MTVYCGSNDPLISNPVRLILISKLLRSCRATITLKQNIRNSTTRIMNLLVAFSIYHLLSVQSARKLVIAGELRKMWICIHFRYVTFLSWYECTVICGIATGHIAVQWIATRHAIANTPSGNYSISTLLFGEVNINRASRPRQYHADFSILQLNMEPTNIFDQGRFDRDEQFNYKEKN